MMGDGADEIGPFTIGGTRTPTGEVNFMKQYHGAHCVNYKGHMSPDGTSITGNYSVGSATGGFIMTMEN